MKNHFKIFKKPLAKSILAGFVTSFTVLNCVFFCCSAMKAGDDLDYSDSSVDSVELAHNAYKILTCPSKAEKRQILSDFSNMHPSQKSLEKLIKVVETTRKEMEKSNISDKIAINELSLAVAEGKDITSDMFGNNSDNIKNCQAKK